MPQVWTPGAFCVTWTLTSFCLLNCNCIIYACMAKARKIVKAKRPYAVHTVFLLFRLEFWCFWGDTEKKTSYFSATISIAYLVETASSFSQNGQNTMQRLTYYLLPFGIVFWCRYWLLWVRLLEYRKESLPLTDMRYTSGWVDEFTADQHAVYKWPVRKQLHLPKYHWQMEFFCWNKCLSDATIDRCIAL